MSGRLRVGGLALLLVVGLALPLASAHEDSTVGAYSIEIGWQIEPPSATHSNGIEVMITTTADGAPVNGLSGQLSVTVSGGSASLTQQLLADPLREGVYIATLTPTVAGT